MEFYQEILVSMIVLVKSSKTTISISLYLYESHYIYNPATDKVLLIIIIIIGAFLMVHLSSIFPSRLHKTC